MSTRVFIPSSLVCNLQNPEGILYLNGQNTFSVLLLFKQTYFLNCSSRLVVLKSFPKAGGGAEELKELPLRHSSLFEYTEAAFPRL